MGKKGWCIFTKHDVAKIFAINEAAPCFDSYISLASMLSEYAILALMKIAQHLNISKATANRHIKQLIKQAIIVKTGKGRSTAYQLKK